MSRYSKAQLHAISKSYSNKRKKEIKKKADEMGILKFFYYQSTYKTLTGFVNAYGSKKFNQACDEASQRIAAEYRCFAKYAENDFKMLSEIEDRESQSGKI